jgi:general secretion pathway protein D
VKNGNHVRWAALILALVTLTGCAAQKAYHRAEKHANREAWDEAVLDYSKAVALDPGNTRYSVALERAKLKASAEHFQKGRRYANAAQWELAISEFQQTLLLYPGNQHAATELDRAMRELRRLQSGPSELEVRKKRARDAALGPPKLDPESNIPIVLNFRDTEVEKIFEAMSKASGINFIFDEKTDLDKPMTIDIGNVTLEKALDILMLQTKNFYKVIDEATLLIAPDTRQKRQEYEDQVIRTFFLSNGDTKQVVTLLRSLLQSRQIAENPELNSVAIKDTPDKVAIAERIINANDKSKGEVLVDVELLEINRSIVKNLGIDLSSKTLSVQFGDGGEFVPLNNLDVLKQQGNWIVGPIPTVILNFLKSDSETRSIAKPQLRVTEGEKAEILIGDRVPIPTTSFNTGSSGVGGVVVPITSFTYQNVGITVQIEPRVHHNKEVTLTVSVEVSSVTGTISTGTQGQEQPIIGTRNIQTVIRLRDGETNVLAGLIKNDDTETMSGVAGIMDIPGIRKIFSNTNVQTSETDIILTLTPHIIRIPDITEDDLATLWVGTEEHMRLRGSAKNALGASPFGQPEAGAPDPTQREPIPLGIPGSGTGGSISRTLPPPEGSRDTEQASAQRDRRPPPEPSPQASAPGTQPTPTGAGGAQEQDPGSDVSGDAGTEEQQPPAGLSTVRLVPSQASYRVGDTIVVEVVIDGAENVGSVPFHLRYNPQVVEFLVGDQGTFMSSDGAGTIFLARPTAANNEVVVGLSRMGGDQGMSGSGTLAVFQFQAINPGDCGFGFTGASVKDPRAQDMPATFVPAPVQVEQ